MLRGASNQVFCKCHRTGYSMQIPEHPTVGADLAFANTKNINCNGKVSHIDRAPSPNKAIVSRRHFGQFSYHC